MLVSCRPIGPLAARPVPIAQSSSSWFRHFRSPGPTSERAPVPVQAIPLSLPTSFRSSSPPALRTPEDEAGADCRRPRESFCSPCTCPRWPIRKSSNPAVNAGLLIFRNDQQTIVHPPAKPPSPNSAVEIRKCVATSPSWLSIAPSKEGGSRVSRIRRTVPYGRSWSERSAPRVLMGESGGKVEGSLFW